jgi:hypothetical protein
MTFSTDWHHAKEEDGLVMAKIQRERKVKAMMIATMPFQSIHDNGTRNRRSITWPT